MINLHNCLLKKKVPAHDIIYSSFIHLISTELFRVMKLHHMFKAPRRCTLLTAFT